MDARWMKGRPKLGDARNCKDERRSTRTVVTIPCEVVSSYEDEPRHHIATSLSTSGIWLDAFVPLHPGAVIVLSFRPPMWQGRELVVFGRVSRVSTGRRRADRGSIGMGIRFTDLTAHEHRQIDQCLEDLSEAA